VNELLVQLGKRIRDLRAARKWSQEEFAHVSGLHRTYIGQIERGEKNISFANLSKVSIVLGVNFSELLAGLEDASPLAEAKRHTQVEQGSPDTHLRLRRIQKLLKQLKVQRAEVDRTIAEIEQLAAGIAPLTTGRGRPRRMAQK
jgi:transcriptional regulator with XRE-family HTH domain